LDGFSVGELVGLIDGMIVDSKEGNVVDGWIEDRVGDDDKVIKILGIIVESSDGDDDGMIVIIIDG